MKIATAGGIEAIIGVVRLHTDIDDDAVLESGTRALERLSTIPLADHHVSYSCN